MLITQTAGRGGRGTVPGHVIVQAYCPEHYALSCGIRQDYEGFFSQEILLRKELFYPPFSRLVKLLFQHEDENGARQHGSELVEQFRQRFTGTNDHQIIGPSPAVVSNFRGIYRFVVLIKTAKLTEVQTFLHEAGMHLRTDVAIDIDPITMM